MSGEPLLEVSGLHVWAGSVHLVDDVSFALEERTRTGLIGESGSGKTLTALSILGLLADGLRAEGSIKLRGRELLGLDERQMVAIRGNDIAMIFQEPMTALNPLSRIGKQVGESLRVHQGMSTRESVEAAVKLLDSVGIDEPERRAKSFPHELSGGQRQRAMIAGALACGPDLVVADEPTTALDVTVQQQVLDVLRDQVIDNDAALLLITHDLPVVSSVTERVMVMRHGKLLEVGPTGPTFANPADDYTRGLVASVPPMSREGGTLTSRETSLTQGPSVADDGAKPVIVAVRDVRKSYKMRRSSLFESPPVLHALDSVSLDVYEGETFGIVGESGSGKSTLARLMVGLTQPDSGSVSVAGIDPSTPDGLDRLRRTTQMIFQDPMGSLDPRMTVNRIISEPLRALKIEGDHEARVASLLESVSLDPEIGTRYPHEFSGGQRQRIAIARALAPSPKILVADEAVSALDMSVQTITLDLLAKLKTDFDLTMIFISHDLSVVADISDRVAVLEHGRLVESGSADAVFGDPQQEYTRRLLASVPRLQLS